MPRRTGGRRIVFGDITTGASSDLQSVTNIARSMVTSYGMSGRLGPMTYGEKEELVFLGRELGEQRNYSDETAEEIDQEIKRIVDEAYVVAKTILTEYRYKLDEIANKLLEQETIDIDEFEAMFSTASSSGLTLDKEPVLA